MSMLDFQEKFFRLDPARNDKAEIMPLQEASTKFVLRLELRNIHLLRKCTL